MNLDDKKKEIVRFLLEKDILLSASIIEKLDKPENIENIHNLVLNIRTDKLLLLGEEFEALMQREDISEIDWKQFEKSKAMHEKGKDDKMYEGFKQFISATASKDTGNREIRKNEIKINEKKNNEAISNKAKSDEAKSIEVEDRGFGSNNKASEHITREHIKPDNEYGSGLVAELAVPKQKSKEIMAADTVVVIEENGKKQDCVLDADNLVNGETSILAQKKELASELPKQSLKNEKNEKKVNSFDDVRIVFSYEEEPVKQEIQDFVSYYNKRYEAIEKILRCRQELAGLTSISRLLARRSKEKEVVSIIGLVRDKQTTKNGNTILILEDSSGEIKVLITKNKPDLYEDAKNIVFDEVIGVVGSAGDNIVFANRIVLPDIPLNKELKKLDEEVYAVFLSDIHVGSNNFLPEQFNKFVEWLNGNFGGDNHKSVARKVKYVFIIGDLVDGVGIYPGQEAELVINEINEQYAECARFLSKIPEHIRIIICAGNHDAMRISEPQLPLYRDFASPIYDLPNTVIVSNPAIVNIAAKENFSGFDVLMYHGYSFDYYVANVDSIRQQGGYDRADLIMKFLLQRRHLAPTHKSTLYIADTKKDPLFINIIPDIFATGHIHKSSVSSYRNITTICGSCWQAKTSFQEKVGHNPEPARVPIVNLQTRETKILRFG